MTQLTRPDLIAHILAALPTNTTGQITASTLRTVLTNVADSTLNYTETSQGPQGVPGATGAAGADGTDAREIELRGNDTLRRLEWRYVGDPSWTSLVSYDTLAPGTGPTPDTTPTAFSFADISGAATDTVYTSNTITVAGINTAAPISVQGGLYSINGGQFVSSSGLVNLGDNVQVRGTSSALNSTATNVTLTIGGVSDTFTVTTLAATGGSGVDIDEGMWKLTIPLDSAGTTSGTAAEVWPNQTPNLLTLDTTYFDRQTDGSIVFRAPVNGARTSGSNYSRSELRQILPDGTNEFEWTVALGGRLEAELAVEEMPTLTVGTQNRVIIGQIHGPDDEMVRVYFDYSSGGGKLVFADDKAGGGTNGTETFFELKDDSNVSTNIPLNSRFAYVIEGDTSGARVTAHHNGKKYQAFSPISLFWPGKALYFKAGAYNAVGNTSGSATNRGTGQSAVHFYRLPAPLNGTSGSPYRMTATSGNVASTPGGGGSDVIPDAFVFTDVTGATTSTVYTSNTITISGINAPASISVSGGTYSINGGTYTSLAGTINNGQTVTVRVTSSSSASQPASVTLTIGGISDTFTVTTGAGTGPVAPFLIVSPSGSDTSGTGTLANPFQTIDKAVTTATAGTNIYLRGAIYNIATGVHINKSGTSANRYSLQSYPGEKAIISGSSMPSGWPGTSNAGGAGINMANASYWTVQDLEIRDAASFGLHGFGTTSNCIFRRLSIHHTGSGGRGEGGMGSGVAMYGGGANLLFEDVDSYSNGGASAGDSDGFQTCPQTGGTGWVLRRCRSWFNADDGFDCYQVNTGQTQPAITYENCWAYRNGRLADDSGWSTGDGQGFKMGGRRAADSVGTVGHHIYYGCLSWGNKAGGFDENSSNGGSTGVDLLNCTAYNNSAGTSGYYNFGLFSGAAHVVRNCLSYGSGGLSFPSGASGTIAYHGDSTTEGGIPPGSGGGVIADTVTEVMDANLPAAWTVANRGVGGATTADCLNGTNGVSGSLSSYLAGAGSLVQYHIFEYSLNDQAVMSVATFKANIETIVSTVRAAGKTVILATSNPTHYQSTIAPYCQAVRDVCTAQNVPLIDQNQMVLDFMAANSRTIASLTYDSVHPLQELANLKGQYAATRFKAIFNIYDRNSWNSGVTVTNADFESTSDTGMIGARATNGALPVTNFLRLASTSDLINAGVNIGRPFLGSAPDIGCFEFDGTPTGGSSEPWLPQFLATLPRAWMDAQDETKIVQSGGLVSVWGDKSGTGHDATASGTARPSFVSSAINGRPALSTNGGTQRMVMPSTVTDNMKAYAMIAQSVGKLRFGIGDADIWDTGDSDYALTSPFLACVILNAGTVSWYKNGTLMGSSTDPTPPIVPGAGPGALFFLAQATSVTTGARLLEGNGLFNVAALNRGWNGYIGEWLFLDYEPTTLERQRIEGYILHHWGMAADIPVSHPFKSGPPTV